MTDLDKFKELFTYVGLEYQVDSEAELTFLMVEEPDMEMHAVFSFRPDGSFAHFTLA